MSSNTHSYSRVSDDVHRDVERAPSRSDERDDAFVRVIAGAIKERLGAHSPLVVAECCEHYLRRHLLAKRVCRATSERVRRLVVVALGRPLAHPRCLLGAERLRAAGSASGVASTRDDAVEGVAEEPALPRRDSHRHIVVADARDCERARLGWELHLQCGRERIWCCERHGQAPGR